MRRVGGILNGIAVPTRILAHQLGHHLGLLDEILGHASANVDDPGLGRPLHDLSDLIHIPYAVDDDRVPLAHGHDHAYAPGAVPYGRNENGHIGSMRRPQYGGLRQILSYQVHQLPRGVMAGEIQALDEIGYVNIAFMEANLGYKYIVDPVDLALVEVGIIGAGAALVVNNSQTLAQVMKEVGSRAHQAVDPPLPDEIGDELGEASRDHGPGQAQEDRHILLHHPLPDLERCSQLASLKAHLAHVLHQLRHPSRLHGYGRSGILTAADIIMALTAIHFIPQDFSLYLWSGICFKLVYWRLPSWRLRPA